MATASLTKEEVKKIQDDLECSPQQESSKIYMNHHDNPKANKVSGGKSGATGSEKGFKAGRKMATK